jgi:pimeloyl-ACP methyl ester carboxylesterase
VAVDRLMLGLRWPSALSPAPWCADGETMPDRPADASADDPVPSGEDAAAGAPGRDPAGGSGGGPVARLSRHTFTLESGHRIGLTVSGRGVPLVVVHGFTAEGFLYAETLERLVATGFKVVAIDLAGHGATQGLPLSGGHLGDYAALMGRAIEELGIRQAVLAGHSMGGRVTAQLAAQRPEQAIAVLLIDAIVGDEWDRMVNLFRLQPWLLAPLGWAFALDTMTTMPVVRDPVQAVKLGRLLTPVVVSHATHPWRLIGPAASILRTRGSRGILDELAIDEVPTFVLHGRRDLVVPMATARSAARRANGQLITVEGAAHSWMLRDPETLPAIVAELLRGRLGDAIREAIGGAGATSIDEIEALLYEPDAPILDLAADTSELAEPAPRRPPRYRWTTN